MDFYLLLVIKAQNQHGSNSLNYMLKIKQICNVDETDPLNGTANG